MRTRRFTRGLARLGLMALLCSLGIFSLSLITLPHIISISYGALAGGYFSYLVVFVEDGATLIVSAEGDAYAFYLLASDYNTLVELFGQEEANLTAIFEAIRGGRLTVLANATGRLKGEFPSKGTYMVLLYVNTSDDLAYYRLDVRERTRMVPAGRSRLAAACLCLLGLLLLAPMGTSALWRRVGRRPRT